MNAPESPRVAEELEARFWKYVMPVPECGCWLWIGNTNRGGYGRMWDGSHTQTASRWAYQHFVGPIPDGLTIDHKCRVRCCVNPDHLRPLTNKDNVLIGLSVAAINAKKTHCIHGHEFTPRNTYWSKTIGREGRRACRICASARRKRVWTKHRATIRAMMVKP